MVSQRNIVLAWATEPNFWSRKLLEYTFVWFCQEAGTISRGRIGAVRHRRNARWQLWYTAFTTADSKFTFGSTFLRLNIESSITTWETSDVNPYPSSHRDMGSDEVKFSAD